MERYFVQRTEGDFSETQKIKAEVGHAHLARLAYAACAKKFEVKDGRSFFDALRSLLSYLGKAGYTKQAEGWGVTGGRFVAFSKMTHQQIFATWASVQQTIAKWVWNIAPAHTDLHCEILTRELVFKANDVQAVMELLFEVLQLHKGYFAFDDEIGAHNLEGRLVKCLQQ